MLTTPIVARFHKLLGSSSATETLKLVRRRSFRLRRTCRLSLSDCAASMCSSRVRKAIMNQWPVDSGQLPVAVKPLAHRALVLLATNHSPLATLLRHCFRGNSLGGEGFDRIADFDVPVVGDGDAALHAVGDLAGIVFEAA